MFKQRLLTSIIIVLLVVFVLFYGPVWLKFSFALVLLALCAKEWLQLIPLTKWAFQTGYLFGFVSILGCGLWYFSPLPFWSVLTLIVWLLLDIAILFYPSSQTIWGHKLIVATLGYLVLGVFFHALIRIMQEFKAGASLVMFTVMIVWMADVGAYLCGKIWGRHKMIPKVSPGKSWEGLLGGFMLVMITGFGGQWYFQPVCFLLWWFGMVLMFIQSVFGDLSISMLKRRCQLKDTGAILPGHGGMLDRLDSLLSVMPLALIVYRFCMVAS